MNFIGRTSRILILSGASLFLFVFLLIQPSSSALESTEAIINTAATVTMSSCYPCHNKLDAFKNPTLIFKHGIHFDNSIECKECHQEFPHQSDTTIEKPPAAVCYECHGQEEAKGVLASRKCDVCHLGVTGLTPASHAPGAAPTPSKGGAKFEITMPITLSNCSLCHPNLDGFDNPALNSKFKHDVHFARRIRCLACHQEYPHQQSELIKPGMGVCVVCHGLNHGNQGLMAPKECQTCHPPDFNLIPSDHQPLSEWRAGVHGKVAKKDRRYCYSCHLVTEPGLMPKFCRDCHGVPEMPHPDRWKEELHPVQAKANRQVCYRCHPPGQIFCNQCHHKDYDPSWGPWVSSIPGQTQHWRVVRQKGAAFCLTCHGPVFCPGCHIRGSAVRI